MGAPLCHRYENALVFKLFVVQFLNSYAPLYYVAFMKRDLEGCKNDHCVEDLRVLRNLGIGRGQL